MHARKSSPPAPIENGPSSPIENESLTPAEMLRRQCVAVLAQDALTDAVRVAEQAMQRRSHIETAIARSAAQKAAAAQRIVELDALRPQLETQLALASADAAFDPGLEDEIGRLSGMVDEATRERSDKQLEAERCTRNVAVLEREIVSVDAEIAAARTGIDVALSACRAELLPHIDEAVAAAAASLTHVKAVLRGLLDALPGFPLRDDVEALRVVAPGAAYVERSGVEVQARGDDLLSHAEPISLAESDGLTGTINRLRAHRAYTVSKGSIFEIALQAPYEPRSAPRTQLEEWAQEAQREATKPPASRFTGNSWTGGSPKARHRQA